MSIDNPLGQSVVVAKTQGGGAMVAAEQQRAMAEVQAAMVMARANPRDPIQAMDLILNDCSRQSLAETALYTYSRGGTEISGPSIRLAEAIARRWTNLEFGVKELSSYDDHSVVMAYAWCLESNVRDVKTFTIKAWRDTKKGGYKLTDERDRYENLANQAARRKRACILAVIPGDVVEAAVAQCELTLNAKADNSPEGVAKMVEAFVPFGVTREQIEKRIQRRIDAITPAQMVGLKKVWSSLRDGMGKVADYFEVGPQEQGAEPPASKAEAVLAALKSKPTAQEPASAPAKAKAAPEPHPEPQSPPAARETPVPAAAEPPAKAKPSLKPSPKPVPAPAAHPEPVERVEAVDRETGGIRSVEMAPGVTYARVMDMVNKATSEEEIEVALGFAQSFPEDQEMEVKARASERRREIEDD